MPRLVALLAFLLAAVPAGAASGKLVLYTSQPNADAQGTIDAFRLVEPNVEVSFVRDGTPRIMARLRAEIAAGRPQADLLLIADAVTMEALKKEGRLFKHEAAPVADAPAGLNDPDKHWFSTKLITTGIAYNTASPFKPTSWADLTKPEAKDQVVMPSPLASGAALIHVATLTTNLAQGWGYFEALAANGAKVAGGNGDVLKQVAGGERLIGVVVDYLPIREAAKGAPVAFVAPADGVSAVTEPVAILSTTGNPEAAKAFVDFLVSPKGQQLAAAQGYLAASPAVAPPPGFPAREAFKLLPLDPAKALADEAANRKRFQAIFGG